MVVAVLDRVVSRRKERQTTDPFYGPGGRRAIEPEIRARIAVVVETDGKVAFVSAHVELVGDAGTGGDDIAAEDRELLAKDVA